jgi:hypothetical protein
MRLPKDLLLTYFIILVLQYLYWHFYLSKWSNDVEHKSDKPKHIYTNELMNELENVFCEELHRRINLLDQMTYSDWIDYNNQNVYLSYKNEKYYFFIYERLNSPVNIPSNDSLIIQRVNANKDLLDLDFNDEIKDVNEKYVILSVFPTNPNLPNEMFGTVERENGCASISYFWADSIKDIPIKKKTIFKKFHKKKNEKETFEGLIAVGYTLWDLNIAYSNVYYNYLSPEYLIKTSLLIFIISLLLYYSSSENVSFIALFFMIIFNIVFTYQISQVGAISTIDIELQKKNQIHQGILSITFLAAVNIFILQTLNKYKLYNKKISTVNNQSAILFCVSLSFILLSLFEKNNFKTVNELRTSRIGSQIYFNMAILTNMFIFIGYLYFIFINLPKKAK